MENKSKRKTDRRSIYTKNAIKDAFLSLMSKMAYDKINVTKICELSEISRATFYLHYSNIDEVLDETLDDALLFSEKSNGTILDIIDNDDNLHTEDMLPACQRIANSDKYHDLFMDAQIADHIIHKISKHEYNSVVPRLMKQGNLKEDEAEMIFRFILNGSFAVNRKLGWKKNTKWYNYQKLISKFVNSGMENL